MARIGSRCGRAVDPPAPFCEGCPSVRYQPVALPSNQEQSAAKEEDASERDSSSDARIGPVEPALALDPWAVQRWRILSCGGVCCRPRGWFSRGFRGQRRLPRRPRARLERGPRRERELPRRPRARLERGPRRERELPRRPRARLERGPRRERELPRRPRGRLERRPRRRRILHRRPRRRRCGNDRGGGHKPEHYRSPRSESCVVIHLGLPFLYLPTAGCGLHGFRRSLA